MLRVLQAGRGLAAAGVAAFHLSMTMGVDRYGGVPVFTDFTRQGFRGVDFFFVLSGFIIFFAHFKDLGTSGGMEGIRLPAFRARLSYLLALHGGNRRAAPVGVGDGGQEPAGFRRLADVVDAHSIHRRGAADSVRPGRCFTKWRSTRCSHC